MRADLEKLNAPSRSCEDCLSFRMELAACKAEVKHLEKQLSHPCVECDACAAQAVLLSDLREEKEKSDSENVYLRQILSWVSAREPQLGMMIQQFKKENGFGVGYKYSQADFEGVLDKLLGKLTPEERFPKTHNTKGFKPDQPKDGVFQEPPKKPPMKPVWTLQAQRAQD